MIERAGTPSGDPKTSLRDIKKRARMLRRGFHSTYPPPWSDDLNRYGEQEAEVSFAVNDALESFDQVLWKPASITDVARVANLRRSLYNLLEVAQPLNQAEVVFARKALAILADYESL